MREADQLLKEIAQGQKKLVRLENELKTIQQGCLHDYTAEGAHQVCRKCNHVESLHY